MSTEPEPTPEEPTETTEPTEATASETPTDPPPPPTGEEPPPPSPEPPPAPDMPTSPITFEPATWYEVETVCLTADKGDGEPCPNLNTTATDSPVYSNAGKPIIVCGLCGKTRTILSATKLDPQPEMS
jgi:cytoskeletal protein RodZ